jgi:hypothetical protein
VDVLSRHAQHREALASSPFPGRLSDNKADGMIYALSTGVFGKKFFPLSYDPVSSHSKLRTGVTDKSMRIFFPVFSSQIHASPAVQM